VRTAWNVLLIVCTVVGAAVLYCAVMAVLWAGIVRVGRRVGQARRRAAGPAAAGPYTGPPYTGPERRLQAWGDLPGWLLRDRPWAVAVLLLSGPPIRDRTAGFVDFPSRRFDWSGLLTASATWPADQRLMVMTAYELAFDTAGEVERALSEPVRLSDVIELLDDDGVERLRIAMDVHRGRVGVSEALTRLSG